jgi:hypothetical protein
MNQQHEFASEEVTPETFEGCLWALATGGVVLVSFFVAWLSIQRGEIIFERHERRVAEQQATVALRERDAVRTERNATVNAMNERLMKAEAARTAAERETRITARSPAMRGLTPQPAETVVATTAPLPAGMAAPSARELTTFIKSHLLHMTDSVEAQLPDYAEEVDFHDKPRASLLMIENDRRQWTQKYPVRFIFKDEIRPEITVSKNAVYGWVATATFDWRWVYKSRAGGMMRGVTRDTWKIVPSAQGFKIISERSIDPATGQPKD